MEYHVYWLLNSSCFELSGDGNTVFLEPKSWWKDNIYWLLKSSCFELFGDGKYGLFLSQKVDGKMIFTWSFLVFHDIPGLGFFVQSWKKAFSPKKNSYITLKRPKKISFYTNFYEQWRFLYAFHMKISKYSKFNCKNIRLRVKSSKKNNFLLNNNKISVYK